ncbi:hypothetical protein TI39_contig4204g00020 [Zymoseptoria brevis]|uniref:Nitrate reductase [NADPH] n=1 Tax=Zymoseptoria brevis TaxID=1047168 RepID=A0A0F4GB91_9PEZI|nr:hypothetical protein TI39_contig4204g00020 [Zymoseptoria brevis]
MFRTGGRGPCRRRQGRKSKGRWRLRREEAFDWHGVRRNSTWQHAGRRGQPQRSNAAGVVGVLVGVSAVAVLAAPVVSWAQEQASHVVDVHEGDGVKIEGVHDTPTFRLSEVIQHDRNADRKWIIRGNAVYDITGFIACHPGGEVILRACGSTIDPYWKLFSIHDKPEVRSILDGYYIGDIDEQDLTNAGEVDWCSVNGLEDGCIVDPFKEDPKRDSRLIVQTAKPCNAETPSSLLNDFITPVRLFFVRNHLWVPDIEEKEHRLSIELSDGEEKAFTIDDLKQKFKKHTITVTLQCAGNRRSHMSQGSANGKTAGLQWDVGAIGTAEFTGVLLRDVLVASGYDVDKACSSSPDDEGADKHVHFCAPSDTYEQSVPIQTALNPTSDVLLAWEMNGVPMTRDHGGPLRAIVPGSVATRSVKWVGKVRISGEESQSNWHARDYKCFGPNVRAKDLKPEDWEKAQSIQEMPVQSAITNIVCSKGGDNGRTASVQGFAYSGGGRRIVRVDVSADGGETWQQATLKGDEAKGTRRWAWTLWDIDWAEEQLPSNGRHAEFVVKAVDEAYNCQPQTFDATWNFRGLLGNAWHRVPMPAES